LSAISPCVASQAGKKRARYLLGLWPGDRLLAGHPFLFHVSHRIEAQLSAVHKSREWLWGAHMNRAFPQMFPPFSNFVLTKAGELFQ